MPLETPAEQEEYERLLATEQYREALMIVGTSFEKGMQKGQLELLIVQIEERFGALSPELRERIAEWSPDQLTALGRKLVHAESLTDLGLDNES